MFFQSLRINPFDISKEKYQALGKYGKDLTELAKRGKLRPVIGRDDEIYQCILILSRMTKNSPVIIGEPGVGKTAIAEGLAQRIVQGKVPDKFSNKKLISLDMGSLLAGARCYSDFEERLKSVLKEVTASNGEIILFIDDIRTVVNAGTAGGAMDAGNVLKLMLDQREVRCIGATTLTEYRKNIEKDPALECIFQQVYCGQPSVEDTISILRGLCERYELHHGVKISDSALVSAAVLSNQYITDRFLPEKAIDLVDQAAARISMGMKSKPTELDEINRAEQKLEGEKLAVKMDNDKTSKERLRKLDADLNSLEMKEKNLKKQWEHEKSLMIEIRSVKQEVDRVNLEMEYNLAGAAKLKKGTLVSLQKKLEKAEKTLAEIRKSGESMIREVVTDIDIAEIVTERTGIPISNLQQTEKDKLVSLEQELHKRVAGQDIAIKSVANVIHRSRVVLSDPNRPIASFMFMGPTGVGKTELAKALASCFFNTENALVNIYMRQYMGEHALSKLVGAPPGNVGYGEGGQLTEVVRSMPYSVVVFNEVEKAHHKVFKILQQLLDEGRITDSQGRTVSFNNCVVIMTSNIGSHSILDTFQNSQDPKEVAYETMKEEVAELARQTFGPRFMDMIDESIVFQPLDNTQINRIVEIQLNQLGERLKQKKIGLHFTQEAVGLLGTLAFDHEGGAWSVRRVIKQTVASKVALGILRGEFKGNDCIQIDANLTSSATDVPLRDNLIISKIESATAGDYAFIAYK